MKIKALLVSLLAASIAVAIFFWNSDGIKILQKTESDFGSIWVFERNNTRCMSFLKPSSGITQTCMSLENPKTPLFLYTQILLSTLFLRDHPRKILLIGLGGATIPKALNILVPQTQLDIVEINPTIQPLVEKYFDFTENAKSKIFIEDGFEFVKNAPDDEYDLVMLDAFTPDYIPSSFLTDEFVQHVKRIMVKDGIVAINTFTSSPHYQLESELFAKNFDRYYNLVVNNNRIIVASKGDLPDFAQIEATSNLWRYRFVEINLSQLALLALYKRSQIE